MADYAYYDRLRQNVNQDVWSSEDSDRRSSLVEIVDPATQEKIRLGHVSALLPLSWFGDAPTEDANDLTMAVHLAVHHFNTRDPVLVPELASPQLRQCNVKFTWDMRDGEHSAATTSSRYIKEVMSTAPSGYQNSTSLLTRPLPTAMVGAMWSSVTSILSKLAGAYQVPVISPMGSSSEFNSKADHPYYLRTAPSVEDFSIAFVDYWDKVLGIEHIGILYDSASYAMSYAVALMDTATARGIRVLAVPVQYYNGDATSKEIQQAMRSFRSSQYRYFFTINFDMVYYNEVLTEAHKAGLIGPDYSWWISDGITLRDFQNQAKYEPNDPLVEAMEGIGCIFLRQPKQYPRYQLLKEQWNKVGQDQAQVDYIRSKQPESLLEKYKSANVTDFTYFSDPDQYGAMTYDAVITVAMGACESSLAQNQVVSEVTRDETASSESNRMPYFFTGPELYESMTKARFDGASTYVNYIPGTCSRDFSDNMLFMSNLRRNDQLDSEGKVNFEFHTTNLYAKVKGNEVVGAEWVAEDTFYFSDGSSTAPLGLPPAEENFMDINTGALAGGMLMASFAMLLALACGVGTFVFRKEKILKASQPEFMVMICFGCLIMGSSVIPMGLQESSVSSTRLLDMACMSTPWLLCLGFVTSFSVLFAKTLRLNKLVLAKNFRRVVVRIQDVLLPFALLLLGNVIVLTVWTVVSPLRWTHFEFLSIDEFGRSIESKSMCATPEGGKLAVIFCLLALAVINLLSVSLAAYQSFLCRKVKLKFNESGQVFVVLMSILQVSIIGVPVFLTVLQIPSARFAIYALVVSLLCCSILLPLFGPKFQAIREDLKVRRAREQGKPITSTPGNSAVMILSKSSAVWEQRRRSSQRGDTAKTRRFSLRPSLRLSHAGSSRNSSGQERETIRRSSRRVSFLGFPLGGGPKEETAETKLQNDINKELQRKVELKAQKHCLLGRIDVNDASMNVQAATIISLGPRETDVTLTESTLEQSKDLTSQNPLDTPQGLAVHTEEHSIQEDLEALEALAASNVVEMLHNTMSLEAMEYEAAYNEEKGEDHDSDEESDEARLAKFREQAKQASSLNFLLRQYDFDNVVDA